MEGLDQAWSILAEKSGGGFRKRQVKIKQATDSYFALQKHKQTKKTYRALADFEDKQGLGFIKFTI